MKINDVYKSVNAKIDSLQASFLNIQLKRLDKTITKRTKYAKYYDNFLPKNCIIQKSKENKNSNTLSWKFKKKEIKYVAITIQNFFKQYN